MIAIGSLRKCVKGLLLPGLALLLAGVLFSVPMMQTSVTVVMVEECGSKPPPIIEEEVHKSIAPSKIRLATPASPGVSLGRDAGPGDHSSPIRDILVPPPDVC